MVSHSPKSYIGIRVGRRVWAPLWPRQDGSQIYLPDPDQSRSEESPAYQHFRELLADQGFTLNWQTTYNAGANPISIRLRRKDLQEPAVQALLRASYGRSSPAPRPGRRPTRSRDTTRTDPGRASQPAVDAQGMIGVPIRSRSEVPDSGSAAGYASVTL